MSENCGIEFLSIDPAPWQCPPDDALLLFGQPDGNYYLQSWANLKICLGIIPANPEIAGTWGAPNQTLITTLDQYGNILAIEAVPIAIDYTQVTGVPPVQLVGDITGSGLLGTNIATVLANTGIVPGVYGSATQTITVQFDAKGRAISAQNVDIAIPFSQLTDGTAAVNNLINIQKGVAGGLVPLGPDVKIDPIYLPDSILGNVRYKGTYNDVIVTSDDPALNGLPLPAPSVDNKGYYFIATAPFTYGGEDYQTGDWIISDGANWSRVENSDAVFSVFGRIGNVVAVAGDYNTDLVPELPGATNQYFTIARVRNAISATNGVAYDSATGVITHADTSPLNPGTISLTGANVFSTLSYDGFGHVTDIQSRALTAADIGAAPTAHTHTINLTGDVTASGVVSGSIATTISNGAVTYDKIQTVTSKTLLGRFATTNGIVQEISLGSSLTLSDAGVLSASSAGTVSSVGLSMPGSLFQVANSPIETSGTLAVTLLPQGPNLVFAGPATGAAATPTFRALTAADMPGDENLQSVTDRGRITTRSIGAAQGRFSGWYVPGDMNGPAAEIGFENSEGHVGAYDRTTAGYFPMNVFGSTVNLSPSSGINGATVNGNVIWHAGNLVLSVPPAPNTVPQRNVNGYLFGSYFNSTDDIQVSGVTGIMVKTGDNYLRTGTAAAINTFLGISNPEPTLQNVLDNGNSAVNIGAFINGGSAAVPFFAQSTRPIDNSSYHTSHFVAEVTNAAWLAGARPSIGFHAAGVFGVSMYFNADADIRLRNSAGNIYTIWNSGNDGTGSGLDADFVDGVSAERIVWGTNETATLSHSGLSLNGILKSGFYDGTGMTGAVDGSWWTVLNIRHSNPAADYGTQLSQRFTGNSPNETSVALYARTKYNGAYGAWAEVYNSDARPQIMYEWKPFIGNSSAFLADDVPTNTTTFAYTEAGTPDGAAGPLMGFGGFNRGGYPMQIFGNYAQSQGRFYARVRNGDNNTWNPWRELWHTGNLTPSTVAGAGNTVVQRDANGYINTNYIFSIDNSQPNGVTGIMVKAGDNYLRTGTAQAIRDFLGLGNGSFILNQGNSVQAGDFYISGRGTVGGGGTTGSVSLLNGGVGNQGYIEFRYPSANEGGRGTRQGYIGFGVNGMQYVDETGNGHMFLMNVGGSNMRVGGMYGVGTSGFKSYGYGGLIGDYDQNGSASKIIWTIGDNWNSLGTFYGMGYEYANPPGPLGPDHALTVGAAGVINRRLYLNGNDHLNDLQAEGQIRAKGWFTDFGDGPAIEMGVTLNEGYVIAYDRTNSNHFNINIDANKILLNSLGEESRTLGSNVGNLTYGSWFITGFRGGWTGLSFASAPGQPTWMFDTNAGTASGGIYYQGHSAWALYYNAVSASWHISHTSANTIMHTGNVANVGSGANVWTGGLGFNRIRSSDGSIGVSNDGSGINLVVNSSAPTLTSDVITAAAGCIIPNAFWATSGCSAQPMNAVFKQIYGGAGVITIQAAIIATPANFADNTRKVIATLPAGYEPILPIKWSPGTMISADYCLNGSVANSEYVNDTHIQLTITTSGSIICETGFSNVLALFGGVGYKVIPIQVTYVVSAAA